MPLAVPELPVLSEVVLELPPAPAVEALAWPSIPPPPPEAPLVLLAPVLMPLVVAAVVLPVFAVGAAVGGGSA